MIGRMAFDSLPHLRVVSATHLALIHPVRYRGRRDSWVIPAGFRTDLASVPQVFQWLVNDRGAHTNAALLHDWLCHLNRTAREYERKHGHLPPYFISRRDADGIFRRVLREEGVGRMLRWLMWAAVRLSCRVEDGATPTEWAQLIALIPAGLLVVVLSAPPWLGRRLLRAVGG